MNMSESLVTVLMQTARAERGDGFPRSVFGSLIRQAYTEPENTPQPARTADVIYWSLSPEQGSDPVSYNETDASSGSHKPTVHRFLAYQLLVVCYGPSCEANARKIRSFLYIDGTNLPRGILRKAGIYPVPDPPAPQLLSCCMNRKALSGAAARI